MNVGSDRVELTTPASGDVHARYAVAADGMWSPVRRMLGALAAVVPG